jgi:hypothetical protein
MSSPNFSKIETIVSNLDEEIVISTSQRSKSRENILPPDPKRLVVLIPSQITDEGKISRYLFNLAAKSNSDVILLALVTNYEEENSKKMRLATINALISNPHFNVEYQIVWGNSWIKAVKEILRPGDLILCPKELSISVNLFWQEPLSTQLLKYINIPLLTYSGFFDSIRKSNLALFKKAIYWVGLLFVLISFFWIESEIDISRASWQNNLFLFIIVLAEIGAIYFWSEIAG